MILPTFPFLICSSIFLLSNSASCIFPLSPPPSTHLPNHVPSSLSLYSAGGPARRQCMRVSERNLLFLAFQFPFQSLVHSWNQGAVHADEQELTFCRAYIQRRDWQEKGRSRMRRARERGNKCGGIKS